MKSIGSLYHFTACWTQQSTSIKVNSSASVHVCIITSHHMLRRQVAVFAVACTVKWANSFIGANFCFIFVHCSIYSYLIMLVSRMITLLHTKPPCKIRTLAQYKQHLHIVNFV